MPTFTVTAEGQITLTQELLRHLNVAPGQEVEVEMLPGGRLLISPPRTKGSVKVFSGSLEKGDGLKLVDQIKKITEER